MLFLFFWILSVWYVEGEADKQYLFVQFARGNGKDLYGRSLYINDFFVKIDGKYHLRWGFCGERAILLYWLFFGNLGL